MNEPTDIPLFNIWHRRQRWHSENYPTTPESEVEELLQSWYRDQDRMEARVLAGGRESFGLLIQVTRLIWVWYERPEVAPLCERVLELAETLRDEHGCDYQLRESLENLCRYEPLAQAAWDPRAWHVLAWDRAEIAEAQGQFENAIRWYGRFIESERELAPLEPESLDEWFFDLKKRRPSTREAMVRIGRCHQMLGDRASAREAYEAALGFPWVVESPFEEMAALAESEGQPREALHWREQAWRVLAAARRFNLARWSALRESWRQLGDPQDARLSDELLSFLCRRSSSYENPLHFDWRSVGEDRGPLQDLAWDLFARSEGGSQRDWTRRALRLGRFLTESALFSSFDPTWLEILSQLAGWAAAHDAALRIGERLAHSSKPPARALLSRTLTPWIDPKRLALQAFARALSQVQDQRARSSTDF